MSFSFEKTGHPDFHTCNVSAVKSACYKLQGEQQITRLRLRASPESVESNKTAVSARIYQICVSAYFFELHQNDTHVDNIFV